MLIYNAQKDDKDQWDFDTKLTQDEVSFLVNYAITNLLTEGLITVAQEQEEQDIPLPTSVTSPGSHLN